MKTLDDPLIREVEALLRQDKSDEASSVLEQIETSSLRPADLGLYCILLTEVNLHSGKCT